MRSPSSGRPSAARAPLVSLTDDGRARFAEQAGAHAREIDQLFGNLNDEDMDKLRDIIWRIEGDKHD